MSPPLVVFASRYARGVRSYPFPAERANGGRVLPGAEALTASWTVDAHACAYHVPDWVASGHHPRVNKAALPSLQAAGLEPVLSWALVDVDRAAHSHWTDPATGGAAVGAWLASLPPPAPSAAWYLTRGGLRLVWPLESPVPVSEAEPMIRGLLAHLVDIGVPADLSCSDWTRLYRLPRVVRDGAPQTLPLHLEPLL